jgi:hypothetical protein
MLWAALNAMTGIHAIIFVGFEVLTAVAMKSSIFCDIMP